MIREAIERIIHYAADSEARPICTWFVIAICVFTVGKIPVFDLMFDLILLQTFAFPVETFRFMLFPLKVI